VAKKVTHTLQRPNNKYVCHGFNRLDWKVIAALKKFAKLMKVNNLLKYDKIICESQIKLVFFLAYRLK